MKFVGKYRKKTISKPDDVIQQPDKEIKNVTEEALKTIYKEPIQSGISKQDKIDRIKNIVLSDQNNNKSIERLNKFINFSIK
jgi:hypothetical protein